MCGPLLSRNSLAGCQAANWRDVMKRASGPIQYQLGVLSEFPIWRSWLDAEGDFARRTDSARKESRPETGRNPAALCQGVWVGPSSLKMIRVKRVRGLSAQSTVSAGR